MPGAREVLQFVLTADASSAIRGFENVEKSAEKSLGAAESRMAKFSTSATKFGAAGLVVSGLALTGLEKLAKLSSEATTQLNKLQSAADHSTKHIDVGALESFNKEIQKTTAIKADEMFGGQALLVNLGLTTAQIKTLTPLIGDLSQRFGVSFDAAAKLTIKAVNGSANAFKRLTGLSLKEVDGQVGGFTNTVQFLSDTVGGFAELQGKTFEGSLQRMKNSLKDLGENVGAGAVDTLTTISDGVSHFADTLNESAPGVERFAGSVLTWGAIGLGGVSALSLLAGQVTKLGAAATSVGGMVTGLGADFGEIGFSGLISGLGAIPPLAAVAGLALGVMKDQADQASVEAATSVETLLESMDTTTPDAFAKSMANVGDALLHTHSLEDAQDGFANLGDSIAAVAQQVSPAAAKKIHDYMVAWLEDPSKSGWLFTNASEFITSLDIGLEHGTAAANGMKAAMGLAADGAGDLGGAADDASQAISDMEDQLAKVNSAAMGAATGAKAFGKSLDDASNTDEGVASIQKLGDAYRDLVAKGKDKLDLASLKQLGTDLQNLDFTHLSEGQSKALKGVTDYLAAARDQVTSLEAQNVGTEAVQAKAAQYAIALDKVATAAGMTHEQVQALLAAYGLTPDSINTAVKLSGVEEAKFLLDIYKTDIDSMDPVKKQKIVADMERGDWDAFKKDVQEKVPPVIVPVRLDANQAKQELAAIKDAAHHGLMAPPQPAPPGVAAPHVGATATAAPVTYQDNRRVTIVTNNPPGTTDTLKGIKRALKLNGDELRKVLAL